jgi:hypothetical protein
MMGRYSGVLQPASDLTWDVANRKVFAFANGFTTPARYTGTTVGSVRRRRPDSR